MKIRLSTVPWIIVMLTVVASAAEPQTNPQAIQEVIAGRSKVAQAAWWGFQPDDSTRTLQAAINSGAQKVVVQKMDSPWIVDKIELASNQEIEFEAGVVVLAKEGAFHGKADALLSAWNKSSITLTGHGATLQMRRADYDGKDYSKAEWRHVLNLHGCSKVTVSGLTLADSGGDGIYLGTGNGGATNRDIVIKDVVCDRNYRQGISVITAENLLIENCVLRNTAGTAPAAGIDFEPNHSRERLVNCVMRNCLIENNQGLALHVYARAFDATTVPMSIRIEKCVTRGSNARSASIITSCGPSGPARGTIDLVDCRFEESGKAGITVGSNSARGTKIRLVNCVLADASDSPVSTPPIMFSSSQGDEQEIGGVEFAGLTVRERTTRPLMKFYDIVGLRIGGLSGHLTVERGGERTNYVVDQAFIDRLMPFDPVLAIPRVSSDGLRLHPAPGATTAEALKIPAHRLRDYAELLLHARQGQTVAFHIRYQQIGRQPAGPMPVEVFSPAGQRVGRLAVELGKEAEHSFHAAETGVYRIVCRPRSHTAQLVSSTHAVSVLGARSLVHFVHTAVDLYFRVPAGTRQFGLRFAGEGDLERLKAAVFDSTGKRVWRQDSIGPSQSFCYDGPATSQDAIWKVRLDRPSSGVFEDHFVELRGVPPLVSFHPAALLRPVR